MLANDSLYQDATVFDQLFAWSRQRLARALPASRDQRWQILFNGFSVLLVASGLFLLFASFQQQSQPAVLAHLLSLALVGTAALHFRRIASRLVIPTPAATPSRPAATVRPSQPAEQAPAAIHANPRQFFRDVKAAGVNVKIARALYSGGIQSAADLNRRTDQQLLAIRGVGPATVRKLRAHFNFVEEYYEV